MSDLEAHRWALLIAHPGHELRAFHFVERTRPLVAVLTDGSGSGGRSRLHQTTRVLDQAGAHRCAVYGSFTDREAYQCLMASDGERFLRATLALKEVFEARDITAVVTDAAEGYNPMHDVCRTMADAAVRMCRPPAFASGCGVAGRRPLLFEIDLVGPPDRAGRGIRLRLDDDAFRRKLDAVCHYPELSHETAAATEQHGLTAFRVEFLRRAVATPLRSPGYVPHYQHVGEERVRQGRYPSALRYRDHVRPVLALLQAATITKGHALALDPLH